LLILFNPLSEWIDRTKLFRTYLHKRTVEAENEEESIHSRKKIESFVRFFEINMEDFDPSDIHDYRTFQDFFIRKHAINARPIYDRDNPVSPPESQSNGRRLQFRAQMLVLSCMTASRLASGCG